MTVSRMIEVIETTKHLKLLFSYLFNRYSLFKKTFIVYLKKLFFFSNVIT